jgi:hypothetical protein
MSDTNRKTTFKANQTEPFKNPDRDKPDAYKAYVPQYQVYGKDPGEFHGGVLPKDVKVAKTNIDNPRLKRQPLRQPYASNVVSPIGRGPVPNVGNNMEHTWSSVDGNIVDDLTGEGADPNHPMIDNNDYVSNQAFGFQAGPLAEELQPVVQGKITFESPSDDLEDIYDKTTAHPQYSSEPTDNLLPILANLTDESFLLIVTGVPVCSGPKEEIEDQARALVFGEHEMCEGEPIPVDDIIILKRVKVKVGLFLE